MAPPGPNTHILPAPACRLPPDCREDVAAGMFARDPPSQEGLVASYSFDPAKVARTPDGKAS